MPPELPELVNPVKARMRAGEVALGMIARLSRSGDVVRIAKSTGHDFIFIDAQHSLFSLETIGHMAQVGLNCGTAVRGEHDVCPGCGAEQPPPEDIRRMPHQVVLTFVEHARIT